MNFVYFGVDSKHFFFPAFSPHFFFPLSFSPLLIRSIHGISTLLYQRVQTVQPDKASSVVYRGYKPLCSVMYLFSIYHKCWLTQTAPKPASSYTPWTGEATHTPKGNYCQTHKSHSRLNELFTCSFHKNPEGRTIHHGLKKNFSFEW